jgi:hypothetical protein
MGFGAFFEYRGEVGRLFGGSDPLTLAVGITRTVELMLNSVILLL